MHDRRCSENMFHQYCDLRLNVIVRPIQIKYSVGKIQWRRRRVASRLLALVFNSSFQITIKDNKKSAAWSSCRLASCPTTRRMIGKTFSTERVQYTMTDGDV